MAIIKTIEWDDGSGDKIYLDSNASEGNQTVEVSSDANTGAARTKIITFSTGDINETLTVSQDAGYVTQTFTANPSSSSGTSSVSNASRAYTDENSTTYANMRLGGQNVESRWSLVFNTTAIPQDAIIISVSCKAKASLTSVANITPRTIGLYSGTTLKGETQNLTSSAKIFSLSGETWTRSELSSVSVILKATKTHSNSSPWMYFYGATLTVEYYVLP